MLVYCNTLNGSMTARHILRDPAVRRGRRAYFGALRLAQPASADNAERVHRTRVGNVPLILCERAIHYENGFKLQPLALRNG